MASGNETAEQPGRDFELPGSFDDTFEWLDSLAGTIEQLDSLAGRFEQLDSLAGSSWPVSPAAIINAQFLPVSEWI